MTPQTKPQLQNTYIFLYPNNDCGKPPYGHVCLLHDGSVELVYDKQKLTLPSEVQAHSYIQTILKLLSK